MESFILFGYEMKNRSHRFVRNVVMLIPLAILVAFWVLSGVGKGYWGFEHNFEDVGFNIDAGSLSFGYGKTDMGDHTGFISWFNRHKVTLGSFSGPFGPNLEPDPFGDLEVPPPPTFFETLTGRFEFIHGGDDLAWRTGVTVPFWLLATATTATTVIFWGTGNRTGRTSQGR